MNARLKERVEEALRHREPREALLHLATQLKREGVTQTELYGAFDFCRAHHEGDSDETAYNALLDTMDEICGWCSPDRRLFDTVLPR